MAVKDLELVSRLQRVEKFGRGLAQSRWCLNRRYQYQAITTQFVLSLSHGGFQDHLLWPIQLAIKLRKMDADLEPSPPQIVSITPLLKRLWPSPAASNVTAEEIAVAISHIFTDQLSPVQTGALLTCLHFTGWDRRADVIAKCAEAMRIAASKIDSSALAAVIKARGKAEGGYQGGLVSISIVVLEPYIDLP